ncbi:2-oxoacid:acceptor oxidoreductase subunit alpha [Flammeovirgaceae bacterium SG7u.111]|nr:2-oxoacid:acceptor oxidoreductase subunit alpha [Flammeovirgaceae bacterium SG7u.132]WPO34368.1 2-oxoacid:acceptor oxidoreductase subunit alpha [Flammeovirgaceae bacterium SG7u.111]
MMDKTQKYFDKLTIRFAGDSGDGMQLSGKLFANAAASSGKIARTFPDFPSEIRAPEGTLYGVSAYQVNFGKEDVHTPGDEVDILVAMNASSLKTNLKLLKKGGIIITDTEGFNRKNLRLSQYEESPLESGELEEYNLLALDVTKNIQQELSNLGMSPKNIKKTRNIYVLGVVFWLTGHDISSTANWLKEKFGKKPEMLEANLKVLDAGYLFGQRFEGLPEQFIIDDASMQAGTYRNITGNEATALGMVAAAENAKLELFLGSYPITPATEILQFISSYKSFGVRHLQAEDEIAGICSAIGASYGGSLAFTTTSGPGLALKVEASGLAVMTELPLVIINVQRGGPSTGLPTKPEQSDLLMSVWGRHGESPMPVLAAASPGDCFHMAYEASRIALKYMTPVILLTDGYLANSTEAWKVPDLNMLPKVEVQLADPAEPYQPYKRDDDTLSRKWAVPGMKGLEHRIGGLEKADITGQVSHDPDNHQLMVDLRQQKVDGIANDIPLLKVEGDTESDCLILGWGSTYGAIESAYKILNEKGVKVAKAQLKYINPFPQNLGDVLKNYDKVIVPEMNKGQLATMLRAKYLKEVIQVNKVKGIPFKAMEIASEVEAIIQTETELV